MVDVTAQLFDKTAPYKTSLSKNQHRYKHLYGAIAEIPDTFSIREFIYKLFFKKVIFKS